MCKHPMNSCLPVANLDKSYSEPSLDRLAVWILKMGYGITQPTQDEILLVIQELKLIYQYEQNIIERVLPIRREFASIDN